MVHAGSTVAVTRKAEVAEPASADAAERPSNIPTIASTRVLMPRSRIKPVQPHPHTSRPTPRYGAVTPWISMIRRMESVLQTARCRGCRLQGEGNHEGQPRRPSDPTIVRDILRC